MVSHILSSLSPSHSLPNIRHFQYTMAESDMTQRYGCTLPNQQSTLPLATREMFAIDE